MESLARVGHALSSPRRLELIELLAQGERTVEGLAREAGLSVANASQHLRVLREAGLVEARRDGLHVRYRLVGPDVFDLLCRVRAVAESRLGEVERIVRTYFASGDRLEIVHREELVAGVREGTVLVVDVRPREEFEAGHIPGAVSFPIDEIERRLGELPRDREVVAYCRGPYCLMSFDAVERIRASGRAARRLALGLPEWRASGGPIEVGAP